MARGLNKVLLIGNLGKDPEMKYTQGGTGVVQFSVAVSRSYKNRNGEQVDETEWFRIVAWDKLAETCNEFLRKGSKVYIEGRLQTRKYQGQDGQERSITEVVANEMLLLDSRQQGGGEQGGYGGQSRGQSGYGGGGANEGRSNEGRSNEGRSNESRSTSGAARSGSAASGSFDDEMDMDVDDIPF